MIKKLFYLFIFFAPFTSFFAISAWLRVPIVANQLLFILTLLGVLIYGKIKNKWLQQEDLLLLIFLGLVWLSFLFGFLEKRSFNHSLAYTNSILFLFFLTKYVIELQQISFKEISKVIYYSFLTVSFIMLIDFIGINFFKIEIRNWFSEVDGKISNMDYFIRSGFKRVAGVAEEPGHMALFYNIYFGISLFYLQSKNKIKVFIFPFLLFVICHFAMLSNAGIVLPIVALGFIFSYNKLKKLKISKRQIVIVASILFVFILTLAFIITFDIGNSSKFLEEFFDKVFFNESDKSYSSSGQRLKQWQRAFTNFINRPVLGHGPGFGVDEDPEGYLSVYFTVLADLGIVAFLTFLSFLGILIQKVLYLQKPSRSFLLFCIIVSFLHLIIIADFYHAPFWILLVLIQTKYREEKNKMV